jgi:hypothetical protein
VAEHLRAGWIVYFNGIEIPATACNISSGVWQIPQASIAIPADRIMQRVGADDRVRITIFAVDPYRSTSKPEEPDQFRLAFDGEIVSYSYQATATGRSIRFVAVDLIEALTRIFPHFISSLNSIAKGQVGVDRAAASAVVNPFAMLHSLLTAGLTGGADIKRPYDFIENILRLLLDDTLLTNERSVILTQWFKPWNERTGFSDRFVPSAFVEEVSPTGDVPAFPIFRAAQHTEGINALAQSASRLGMGGPMYKIVQTVFQHVYYELAMIPNPPVLLVNQATREVVGGFNGTETAPTEVVQESAAGSQEELTSIQDELQAAQLRLQELIAQFSTNSVSSDAIAEVVSDITDDLADDAAKAIDPGSPGSMLGKLGYALAKAGIAGVTEAATGSAAAATREANRPDEEALREQVAVIAALTQDLENFQFSGGGYAQIQQPVIDADTALKAAREDLARQQALVDGSGDQVRGNAFSSENVKLRQQQELVAQREAEKDNAITNARYLTSNEQGTKRVLAQYMTKPQLMFGVAPSFNVLWPSMYEQFSYEENFALQPTRTYLGDPHVYNLQAKPGQSIAKTDVDLRALTVGYPLPANTRLVEKQAGSKINQHNFLIEYEEYFKGPVYNQMETPPWFAMLADSGATPDAPNAAGSIQQLYCRYEHERMRASRRNGGVVGPYNPNAVAGFPGVVLDNAESNNHVFGYFTSVSHSFTQTSMSTNISFSHAQTFGEFFGTLSDQYFDDKVTKIAADTPTSVPQHPIAELRDRFQVNSPAKEYYQAMFWGIVDETSPDAIIFDIFDVLAVRNPDGTISDIGFEVEAGSQDLSFRSSEAVQASIDEALAEEALLAAEIQRAAEAPAGPAGTFSSGNVGLRRRQEELSASLAQLVAELADSIRREAENAQRKGRGSEGQPLLTGTPSLHTAEPPEYVIKGAYASLMTEPMKAFAFGSRPICTLEQFIDLRGPAGVRTGFRSKGNKTEGKGADYYVKIFDINNDPVLPVDFSTDGLPCGPVGTDVRRNWEQRLLAFRRKVYTARHPFKA